MPDVTRRLRELDAERALFALWLNPLRLRRRGGIQGRRAPAERVATVKHFATYWKALDSVVVSLTPADRDINLSLGVRARVEELPPAARRLFREASAPSAVWRRFPETALLAVAGRFDGAALFDVLEGFLTPEGRQSLNADLNRQVGALLGGEFAQGSAPRPGAGLGSVPDGAPAA